ncbi:MAG: hypothetical protein IPJ41_07455 [Phycisphaerales bacterium]|nr:hypothetical protein [Phycisphaerales bacterium]
MPGRRATTPLFDLLQTGRARAVEHRLPEPAETRTEPAPKATDRTAAPEPSGAPEAPVRVVGGVVHMPLVFAGVALAVCLAGFLGAWTLGYYRGQERAKTDQAMLASVLGDSPKEVGLGNDRPEGADPKPTTGQNTNASKPPRTGGGGKFITAAGSTDRDPRQKKNNYLHLAAKLDESAVHSAISALATRGIEAFAEVDPGTLKRKDGPLYSLIAAKGVPSGETGSQEARQYLEQVRAAGAAWKKAGGIWDFADAYWKLY